MNTLATTEANPQSDKDLPQLAIALDREAARKEFKRRLPRLSSEGKLRLKDIRVIRHKPGRRCVAEYDVEVDRPGLPRQSVTLIGKTRVRRSGNEGFRLQRAIWDAGFDSESPDGISVPEPIGVISAFQMWFQRKVEGRSADQLLATGAGPEIARRVVRGVRKLHRCGVRADKKHTIHDELKILGDCLEKVGVLYPEWQPRLARLLRVSARLATETQPGGNCGIHRDFYSSQVIVHQDRIWLLDFDLYCEGDPALDVGNFIGHVVEQSVREFGSDDALAHIVSVFEDEFVKYYGQTALPALRLYTDLTLVRHIFLSTKFPERQHLTESLLRLCEGRFKTGG